MIPQTDSKKLLDEIGHRIWAIDWLGKNMLTWSENAELKDHLRYVKLALLDVQSLIESGDLEVPEINLVEAESA